MSYAIIATSAEANVATSQTKVPSDTEVVGIFATEEAAEDWAEAHISEWTKTIVVPYMSSIAYERELHEDDGAAEAIEEWAERAILERFPDDLKLDAGALRVRIAKLVYDALDRLEETHEER